MERMSEVRGTHITRAATLGIYRNIGIWIWRRGADAAMIDQLAITLNALAALDGPSGMITVVGRGVTVPGNAIRKGIVDACRKVTGKVLAGGVVHERDDLVAALVRGVVTGLLLLGPGIFPHTVFRTTTEASNWVRKKLDGKAPSTAEIVAAITEVRAMRAEE
jgi:hypothetical protein